MLPEDVNVDEADHVAVAVAVNDHVHARTATLAPQRR
jgi:hypothetical protein